MQDLLAISSARDVDFKEVHPEGLTIDVGQGIRQTVHVTLQNIPEIVWRVPLHDSVWEAMKKSRSTV